MKDLMKVLVLAVALVLAIVGVAQAAAIDATPQQLTKLAGVGTGASQPGTPDSAYYVITIGATDGTAAGISSQDTLTSFQLGGLSYTTTGNTGTTASANLFRITVWGVPYLVTADTVKAFVDYGQTRFGPWHCAASSAFVPLIAGKGASKADTTGSGYYILNRPSLLTTAANGGLTAWSGCYQMKSDATGQAVPLGWNWARLRLAGDCTAPVYVTGVEVAVPTDVVPNPRR